MCRHCRLFPNQYNLGFIPAALASHSFPQICLSQACQHCTTLILCQISPSASTLANSTSPPVLPLHIWVITAEPQESFPLPLLSLCLSFHPLSTPPFSPVHVHISNFLPFLSLSEHISSCLLNSSSARHSPAFKHAAAFSLQLVPLMIHFQPEWSSRPNTLSFGYLILYL